jgi:hypothetical protein
MAPIVMRTFGQTKTRSYSDLLVRWAAPTPLQFGSTGGILSAGILFVLAANSTQRAPLSKSITVDLQLQTNAISSYAPYPSW